MKERSFNSTLHIPGKRLPLSFLVLPFLLAAVISVYSVRHGLPGSEAEPICGMEEHTHTDACGISQELTCSFPEEENTLSCPLSIHRHTAACLDSSGEIQCGYADFVIHTHNEFCFSGGRLVCLLPEIRSHVHGDACFQTERTLSCGLDEGAITDGHTHSDSCYALQKTYVCGYVEGEVETVHTHDASCYTVQRILHCAQAEDETHVHTDDCYTEEFILSCTQPAEYIHSHTDTCLGTVPCLVCTEPETTAHVHTETCYEERSILVCTRDEIIPHIHDTGCFTTTLNCSQPHSHDQSCYSRIWNCGKLEIQKHTHTEACLIRGHIHQESCFEMSYLCGKEAHTHTELCYTDETSDLETAVQWEQALPSDLSGSLREKVVRIALSQLGYRESIRNMQRNTDGSFRGISRYGQWYGDPYGAWDATFACFCLSYAGIDKSMLSYASESTSWAALLAKEGLFIPWESTTALPCPGDLIFLQKENSEEFYAVGILNAYENGTLSLICGDWQDQVMEIAVEQNDPRLVGICSLPDAADQDPGKDTEAPVSGTYAFHYETDTFSMTVHLSTEQAFGQAAVNSLPDDAAADTPALSMEVADIRKNSSDYRLLKKYVQENLTMDDFHLEVMQIRFFSGDTSVSTENYTVTAEISPKTALVQDCIQALEQEDPADSAELGVNFSVLQIDGEAVAAQDEAVMLKNDLQPPVLTAGVGTDGIVAFAAATANPKFRVQYYAYMESVNTTGSVGLPVIDTDNGGENRGGNLPANGSTPKTRQLFLENISGNIYRVGVNKDALTPVYQAADFEYIHAPNLTYFNRLYENGNYRLREVWVLKQGKNPESTNAADWDIYTEPDSLHFTNRTQSAEDGSMVLIRQDAVIRLVFDTTTGSYTNAAAFYDYDISDGKFYRSENTAGGVYESQAEAGTGTVYAYTNRQGINSPGNYTGNGAKLAYGNSNTGTGLEAELWNGNALNKYNPTGYKGCTFGLTTGLDGSGHIRYAAGVSAPNLFNESTATGKTAYTGWELTFDRDGDTYTLVRAGSGAGNLNRFTHIARYGSGLPCDIYTNFFWPLDSAASFGTSGHDLKFGKYGIRNQRRFFGNRSGTLPTVDENFATDRDHNCYFGMQYLVCFELTEDYIGPLEYYFFGDDDMWVFLDGRLVCDIGGVHSSVGEYVNLWDYLQKGEDAGAHTLSFFYTERGASGSSCYMRFTLPSVSSVTPEQNTGTLRVEKEVVGPASEPGQEPEFNFRIFFTDASGKKLKDDYSYTRYSADGTVLKKDLIIYDGGSFQLRNGEYVIIKYLPIGAKYHITEDEADCITSVQVGSADFVSTREVTGTISKAAEDRVHYRNELEYLLPQTGGSGGFAYTAAGALLLCFAGILWILRDKAERRKSRFFQEL